MTSLLYRRARSRLRASLAPTTSWWWNVTVPPSTNRRVRGLADVVQQRRQPDDQVGGATRAAPPARWPAPARSASARRRPCGGGARRAPGSAPAARAASARPGRCRPAAAGPRRGASLIISLSSSSRTRSAETISRRAAISVIAATTSGAAVKPSCATNRAARIIRSGSSLNDCSGVTGVRSICASMSSQTAEQVDELARRQPDRHRVDREVAPRQVAVERVAELHLGLAGRQVVRIAAVRRDLQLVVALAQADRAELAADVPHRVGPRGRRCARCRRVARTSRSPSRCPGARARRRARVRRRWPARGPRTRRASPSSARNGLASSSASILARRSGVSEGVGTGTHSIRARTRSTNPQCSRAVRLACSGEQPPTHDHCRAARDDPRRGLAGARSRRGRRRRRRRAGLDPLPVAEHAGARRRRHG